MYKYKSLTPDLLCIVREAGTEAPHVCAHHTPDDPPGRYLCRACGRALFRSTDQFDSHSGWPSFDAAVGDTVKQQLDKDGQRTEIQCRRCQAHLGHLFIGEGLTVKNRRYCLNSLALEFVPSVTVNDTEEGLFAGGCFWGVQYQLQQLAGVLHTEVGYTGGHTEHPTYQQVCTGRTGHFEAVRVVYDPDILTYSTLIKHFFSIHHPEQAEGQGPDRGTQYRSAIFYFNDEQRQLASAEIALLEKERGTKMATQLMAVGPFWPAEEYHQNYQQKKQNK